MLSDDYPGEGAIATGKFTSAFAAVSTQTGGYRLGFFAVRMSGSRQGQPSSEPGSLMRLARGSSGLRKLAQEPPSLHTLDPERELRCSLYFQDESEVISMFSSKLTRPIAIGAAALAIGGGTYGIVSATASTGSGVATPASSSAPTSAHGSSGSGGSNARSGPAAGGSIGTVDGVSESGFTMTTPTGQKVTVKRSSSTKYRKGTKSSSASIVKKGVSVLVLGRTSGTTITAATIAVQTTGAPETPSAAGVVPFERGSTTTSKQVGQVPASYAEGSGTIVGGTAANKATEAALAAYPGGVVDRVVRVSNGEYEVHNIGVDWPHHVFVDQSFEVVGAD